MLTQPTVEQLLNNIADDLTELVAPAVVDDAARTALGIITQLLRRCAVRSAHEIAWMTEETREVLAVLVKDTDPATQAAVREVNAQPGDDLETAAVAERYRLVSAALSHAIDAAHRNGDTDRFAELGEILKVRNAHELVVLGALSLVGRG